jgi:hypothetical protein
MGIWECDAVVQVHQETHFEESAHTLLALRGHEDQLRAIFQARRARQLPETPAIHLTSFLLNPVNVDYTITLDQAHHVHAFLERYAGGRSPLLRAQFGDYRAHEGVFTASSPAWEVRDNAVQFWTEIKPFAPELDEFALRLLHTPANSVPSERSFSTRNLIQDLKRNALDPAVADKVSYVHPR